MTAAYTVGAKGNTVRRLQQELGGLKIDGWFGDKTAEKIAEARLKFGLQYNGRADSELFVKLGLEWPSVMRRCLDLTNAFEGTGYGDCNSTDIDGWGLTFGVVGFTSKNGEAQKIITKFLAQCPEAYTHLPSSRSGRLKELIRQNANASEWRKFFYGSSEYVQKDIRVAIKAWGEYDEMQAIQDERAESVYWNSAVKSANSIGLKSMSAFGLMFDIHVQNGSFRTEHRNKYNKRLTSGMDECAKLQVIAEVVADSANPKWRKDVLSRKQIFSKGEGVVHGTAYNLITQAFEI